MIMTIEINVRYLIALIAFTTAAIATILGSIDTLIPFLNETNAMLFFLVNAVMALISFTLSFNVKR